MSSFGARDGTRTHTAVATRTSNVIVYHSNTLANFDIIANSVPFVNTFPVKKHYSPGELRSICNPSQKTI